MYRQLTVKGYKITVTTEIIETYDCFEKNFYFPAPQNSHKVRICNGLQLFLQNFLMPVPYYAKIGQNALGPTSYLTHLDIFH